MENKSLPFAAVYTLRKRHWTKEKGHHWVEEEPIYVAIHGFIPVSDGEETWGEAVVSLPDGQLNMVQVTHLKLIK